MKGKDFAKVLYHYGLIENTVQDKVKIICPFHEDMKPSMIVDLVQENYYCFGCLAKGRVEQFIMQMENCNELQALVLLEKIRHDKTSRDIKVNIQTPVSSRDALNDAKLYFYNLPKTDWKSPLCNDYLLNRGFSPRTLAKLDVRENFNHIYGVVAPMLDMGEFKGYVCRATVSKFNDYDVDRKYLYNKGFSRANTLVGNYSKPWVLITEGYLDYARAVQYGLTNCVAILGWKITDKQISKLQQYTTCIVSALDNTPTGREGTKYLREYFDVVRFKFPPHRKDLGELKQHEWSYAWKQTKLAISNYKG